VQKTWATVANEPNEGTTNFGRPNAKKRRASTDLNNVPGEQNGVQPDSKARSELWKNAQW